MGGYRGYERGGRVASARSAERMPPRKRSGKQQRSQSSTLPRARGGAPRARAVSAATAGPDVTVLHSAVKQLQIECGAAGDFRVAVHQLAGHLGDLLADGVTDVDTSDPTYESNLGMYPASRDCLRASGFRRDRNMYNYPQKPGSFWPPPWPQGYDDFDDGGGGAGNVDDIAQAMMKLFVSAMKSGTTPPLQRVLPAVLDWGSSAKPKPTAKQATAKPSARSQSRPPTNASAEPQPQQDPPQQQRAAVRKTQARPLSPGVAAAQKASASRLAKLAQPSSKKTCDDYDDNHLPKPSRATKLLSASRLHSLSRPRGEAAVPDWANRDVHKEVREPAPAPRRRPSAQQRGGDDSRSKAGGGGAGGGGEGGGGGGTFADFLKQAGAGGGAAEPRRQPRRQARTSQVTFDKHEGRAATAVSGGRRSAGRRGGSAQPPGSAERDRGGGRDPIEIFVPPALRPPAEPSAAARELSTDRPEDYKEAKSEYLQWLARNPAAE